MNFDTFTLQCFLVLAETGSFSETAIRLNRSQSAISQQITKLEQQIGKPLIIRHKPLSLTPEGILLLSYANKMYNLQRELIDTFREPELTGSINFGLPDDFASVFLQDILTDFVRTHPRVNLNVECDLTLNLMKKFKQRTLDLVLVKLKPAGQMKHSVNMWREKLVWVGRNQTIEQTNTLPLVLSPDPCVYRAAALSALDKKGIDSRIVFSSHSYTGKIAAVQAGLGLTVLPKKLIPDGLYALPTTRCTPALEPSDVSLIKHASNNYTINSFEAFILNKLT